MTGDSFSDGAYLKEREIMKNSGLSLMIVVMVLALAIVAAPAVADDLSDATSLLC